ncbi:serine-rich adhesin for platelets-like isoform X2 [Mercenaria mercenaria]|uniref:serine-rich adhesin for platelets-like isoform X2 n=1 Tax=Mercenaria mercenaria TaxID=6596 RepID=UPI00234EB011|nr:serine-rich adhesin for platelets-like isoform X2 [Mercenaria mercenaria]
MDLFFGFRKTFLSVWLLLLTGNVQAQGLGGDFMVDTALGELPNPLLTMAAQGGGQQPTGTGQTSQASTAQPTSAADPNQQYVLRNEDFTALGNIGHHVRVPVPNIPPANNKAPSSGLPSVGTDGTITVDPKDIIGVADMSQVGADGNPAFYSFNPGSGHASEISALQSALQGTAVDMSGFLPPPFDSPQDSISNPFPTSINSTSTTSTTSTNESTSFDIVIDTASPSQSNTQGINTASALNNLNPVDISLVNTNQGSTLAGSNAQHTALPTNEQSLYDTLINTRDSITKTQDNLMLDSGGAMGSTDINMQSAFKTNEQTISSTGSISGDMNLNDQSRTNTNEQAMLGTGSVSGGLNLNEQSRTNTNEQSMLGTGSVLSGINLNEQSRTNINEQAMFSTGDVSSGMNLNEQSRTNINERSMPGRGIVSSDKTLNEQSRITTNEQSLLGRGTVSSGTNLNDQSTANANEQSMIGMGGVTNDMKLNEQLKTQTNEQTILGTGSVPGDINSKERSRKYINEQSVIGAGGVTGGRSILNYQTRDSQTNTTNLNTNKQAVLNKGSVSSGMSFNEKSITRVNDQSVFGTGSVSGGMNLNEQSRRNKNEQSMFGTGRMSNGMNSNEQSKINTNEQSMFGKGSVSGGMNLNEQSRMSSGMNLNERSKINTNEKSMFGTGSVSGGMKLTEQSRKNKNEQSMFGTDRKSSGMNLNEQSRNNTNEQSIIGTGSVSGGMNLNEQSMFDTGRMSSGMNVNEQSRIDTNEQSMFGTGSVSGGMSLPEQSRRNTNENSILGTGTISSGMYINEQSRRNINKESVIGTGGVTGKKSTLNYLTNDSQTKTNNMNTNELLSKTDLPRQHLYSTDINAGVGTLGQTDTFTTGKGSKQSLSGTQSIMDVNELSVINTGATEKNNISNKLAGVNIGRKGKNTAEATNEQSMINKEMQQTGIITNDKLMLSQIEVNEPSVVNVDANIGVRKGHSNTGFTTVGGLFGVVGRQNEGSSSPRFTGLSNNNNIITKIGIGGGEQVYATADNIATGTSQAGTQLDSIQQLTSGTASLLGVSDTKTDNILNNNEQLSLSLTNSVTSTADSSNNVSSQRANSVMDRTSQNVPHVSDLNTEGIYPFEGSLTAMDATLAEGSSAVLDMSSVLQGKEPLHLEPSMNIIGEVVSGASISDTSGSNTGIYAVAGGSNVADINQSGINHLDTSTGRSVSSTRDVSSGASMLTSSNNNKNHVADISFVSGGSEANGLAIDKVNQYVGSENVNNKQTSLGGGNGIGNQVVNVNKITNENRVITSVENTSQIKNIQNRLTEGDQRITDASKLSNDHTKGLAVAVNINNDINTFNKLGASNNILINKDTTITDGAGVAMSGFSGAPITNMVGVRPGTSRGGLTVKGINIPSYQIHSRTEEFSSNSSEKISGSISGNSDIPVGSFVIGAGQPNSKVINTGIVGSLSPTKVGGVAIGSGMSDQSPNIPGISLPQSAFKSNDRLNLERKQTNTEKPKAVKVDMSSFIPPPYEEPKSSNTLNVRGQSKLRKGVIADVATNAALLDKRTTINNQLISNQGSADVPQFNEHLNNRFASNGGPSSRHGMGLTGTSSTNVRESSNIVTSSEHFGKPGSVDVPQFNEHLNNRIASNRGLFSRHSMSSTLRDGATGDAAANSALPDRQNTIDRINNQIVSSQGSAFNEQLNNRIDSNRGLSSRHSMSSTLRDGATVDAATNAALLNRQNSIDRINNQIVSSQDSAFAKQFNEHLNNGIASNRGLSSRHSMSSTLRDGATVDATTNAALLNRLNTIDRINNQIVSSQGSAFNEQLNNRIDSNRGLSSRHSMSSTLRDGATVDAANNAALLNRQNSIDRINNQIVSSQGSAVAKQFNEHLNNRIASNGGSSSRHGMGLTDTSSTNSRTSVHESSNIVASSEHFGKPIRSDITSGMSPRWQRSKTVSTTSVGERSAVPSIVRDHAIFTDMAKDPNPRHRNNEVAVALDIHSNTNQVLERLSAEQFTSQPIVGSIFGTVENSSSSTLTKKFLEKSGITREPAVDFMTTFLQHSKPTRTLNRGNKSLQIVPLGSDMSNLSPNTDKIIISGRQSDAQTVDQFGVADIYTRRQQLNPSQWQQLMSKVSHEPTPRLNGINVDYQTQNVIGAGETRPLTSNINKGASMSRTGTSSGFSSSTQTRNIDRSNTNRRIPLARQSNLRSAILFEAPGMTGHKSVTIRNYFPRTSKRPSSKTTMQSRLISPNEVGQQSLQEFVGTQATAERTSSFANTFRQNQEARAMGVPIFNKNNGVSVNSVSMTLKDQRSADPKIQPQGRLGEAGQKIQNEMNTFKLGRSILISDGVIPEFTGPNSVHRLPIDASDLRSLSANGIRLGQPTIMSQGGSTGSEKISSQQSKLTSISSQMVNSQQSGAGSLNSQIINNRQPSMGSVASPMTNSLQSNLGSLDSEMTNILQSRTGSLDSQMINNRQSTKGSIDSQTVNNIQNSIGSIDSQMITNRQSNAGSPNLLIASNRQSRLGSVDSQLLNSRQSRLGSLDSQMLNSRQSTQLKSLSEAQKTSPGEIRFQDIQGSSFAVGLGSDSHGKTLSNRLGIAIGGGLNSDVSGGLGLSRSQNNIGIAVNGNLNSAMNIKSGTTQTSSSSFSSDQAIQNIGLTVADQAGAGVAAANIEQRNLDTATILGLNNALKKQPMEATLFTSGSRFAVFGRANDVAGRSLSDSMQAKPIPARRMGVLGPVHDCRYKPDPSSEYYFIYKNGITQHRFRCALGTAFDEMTCECSIRVSDHGDCLEVHMDFNNGIVEDSSLNRLPIGNDKVEITNSSSPIAGIALFGGDGKLTIWRYQNYDFRDHIMLKVQFRPGVGGDRYQPLISNCDGGGTGPSVAIIYDSTLQEVILLLQTVNDTMKELKFNVNPNEWNDVTYIYDGQEFIGIVNGVRRYVSRENPHLLGIIGGEIKSTPAQGLIEIRDAAVVLGHCPMYGNYRGAMVDIQVYTCIPKDFRLE